MRGLPSSVSPRAGRRLAAAIGTRFQPHSESRGTTPASLVRATIARLQSRIHPAHFADPRVEHDHLVADPSEGPATGRKECIVASQHRTSHCPDDRRTFIGSPNGRRSCHRSPRWVMVTGARPLFIRLMPRRHFALNSVAPIRFTLHASGTLEGTSCQGCKCRIRHKGRRLDRVPGLVFCPARVVVGVFCGPWGEDPVVRMPG